MTKTDDSSNDLTPPPAKCLQPLNPSQYSLQVNTDENGKETISLTIHCSSEQASKGLLKVFKYASGNYGVGFVTLEQAKSNPDNNWKKSLELFNSVLKEID